MSNHWLNQEVTKKSEWHCQFWHAVTVHSVNLITKSDLLDDAIAASNTHFKHDKTTSVAMLELGSKKIVLKRYNPRSQGHKIKRALRQSRARRCWNMSYEFAAAGLNVAAPLLMLEVRFGPIRTNAYFANEYLQGEQLLSSLPGMPQDQQSAVVEAIEQAFEQMNKFKLTHGDMKASNLLWVNGKLYFIDLDAATRHQNNCSWRFFHQKDKKRFLKNWQNYPELLAQFENL